MVWHPIQPICEACKCKSTVTCVSFRSDARVAVEGQCPQCSECMYIEASVATVIANCRRMENPQSPDFDLEHCHVVGKPV